MSSFCSGSTLYTLFLETVFIQGLNRVSENRFYYLIDREKSVDFVYRQGKPCRLCGGNCGNLCGGFNPSPARARACMGGCLFVVNSYTVAIQQTGEFLHCGCTNPVPVPAIGKA